MNIVALGNVCIDHNSTEKTSYEAPGGATTFMSLFFNQTKDTLLTIIASYGIDFLPYKNGLNLLPVSPNISNTLVYENAEKGKKRKIACKNPRNQKRIGLNYSLSVKHYD